RRVGEVFRSQTSELPTRGVSSARLHLQRPRRALDASGMSDAHASRRRRHAMKTRSIQYWGTLPEAALDSVTGGYDPPAICQTFYSDYDYAMMTQDPTAMSIASDEGSDCLWAMQNADSDQ